MPDAQSASNAAMPLRVRLRGLEWDALDSGRRAQVLRLQLRRWGIHSPPAQVVESVCARAHAASPRTWPLPGGWQLAWYRSELSLRRDEPMLSALPEAATVVFTEPGRQPIAAWGGMLSLRPAKLGEWGVLGHLPLVLTLRARRATDRFQAAPASLARSLKKQFQAAGIPQWARHAPVVCEPQGRIVLVPGLGLDARVRSGGGGWMLEWTPMPPTQAGGEPTLE